MACLLTAVLSGRRALAALFAGPAVCIAATDAGSVYVVAVAVAFACRAELAVAVACIVGIANAAGGDFVVVCAAAEIG